MSSLGTRQVGAGDRRKQSAAAYSHFKNALARDPNNADLLGRQAAAALDLGKRKEAARLLEKSLKLRPTPEIFRRNLNLLVSLSFHEGGHDMARRSLEVPIPKWDAPGAPDRQDLAIILSLCRFLGLYRMFPAALELLISVRPYIESDSAALEVLGALHLNVDQPDQAEDALSRARAISPADRPSLMMARAAAAFAKQDFDRAREETERYIGAAPVVLTSAKASQRALVGVTNWRPGPIERYSTPEDVHFGSNIVGQIHEVHSDRYRILSVFCESPNALKAIAEGPKPDIVWNAAVNAELLLRRAAVQRISTLIGIWGAPVINHPENAQVTRRDSAARLCEGIPRLVVPATHRFLKGEDADAMVAEIESAFEYPVIVRGLMEQQGANAFKADNRAELEAAIRAVKGEQFYVIAFFENRTERGHYRKIRAAVAGDFIQVSRVDSDEQWNVHGRKSPERAAWYLSNRELLAEEVSICENPDRFFGVPVMETLEAIRQRIPLDVFGIDFDVTSSGEILLFEANAVMNLLSTAAPGVEHPRRAEDRFVKHLNRLIDSLKG